jgi:hypothetical protein
MVAAVVAAAMVAAVVAVAAAVMAAAIAGPANQICIPLRSAHFHRSGAFC